MLNIPTSLLPAMWRYIPFEAREIGREHGRRLVTHEYPNQDTPYVEDMGGKARRWRIQGFVVGESAPTIRDRIIAACEKSGPGPLLHPNLGLLQARCESLEVRESVDGGQNVVEFIFSFVESGKQYSVDLLSTAVALTKATACKVAAGVLYGIKHLSSGQSSRVQGMAAKDHETRANTLASVTSKFNDQATGARFKELLKTIAASPYTYSNDQDKAVEAWQGAFDTLTSGPDLRMVADILSPLYVASQDALVAGLGTGDETTLTNTAMTDMLLYVSALASASVVTSTETFTTWDDAIAVRDDLADKLAEAAAYISDHDLHAALIDLKGVLVEAITSEAMNLPRVRTLELDRVTTALALAYGLYGNPERASEIVERNGLADPSNVSGTLQVLTA